MVGTKEGRSSCDGLQRAGPDLEEKVRLESEVWKE